MNYFVDCLNQIPRLTRPVVTMAAGCWLKAEGCMQTSKLENNPFWISSLFVVYSLNVIKINVMLLFEFQLVHQKYM